MLYYIETLVYDKEFHVAARRVLSSTDEAILLAHYDTGLSARELAEKYGVHESTVLAVVRRNGGAPRRRGRPSVEPFTPSQRFDILRRHYTGEPIATIARDHHVTASTLWHYLRSRGKLRRRHGHTDERPAA